MLNPEIDSPKFNEEFDNFRSERIRAVRTNDTVYNSYICEHVIDFFQRLERFVHRPLFVCLRGPSGAFLLDPVLERAGPRPVRITMHTMCWPDTIYTHLFIFRWVLCRNITVCLDSVRRSREIGSFLFCRWAGLVRLSQMICQMSMEGRDIWHRI